MRLLVRALGLALLFVLGTGASPGSARAADESPGAAGSAKAHYKLGRTHYQLGEYRDALVAFKEAYRLKQDASFLFNIAQCHRQLGEYAEAIKLYGSYLREAPGAPNRAEVERFVREMKEALDKREKQEPAPVVAAPPPPVVPGAPAVAAPLPPGAAIGTAVLPAVSPSAPGGAGPSPAPEAAAAPAPPVLAPTLAQPPPQAAAAPRPVEAELAIASEPEEARFFVNRMSVGTRSPIHLRLPPGLYSVAIEREGFLGAEGAIALIAGERTAVKGKLLQVKRHGWRGLGHALVVTALLGEAAGITGHVLANRSFQGTDKFRRFSTMEKVGQGVAISTAVLAVACYVGDWLANRGNVDPGPPGLLVPLTGEGP